MTQESESEYESDLSGNEEDEENVVPPASKKRKVKSQGAFTFMLNCVVRLLHYTSLCDDQPVASVKVNGNFCRKWFSNIIIASEKVENIKTKKSGVDTLWENMGVQWDYLATPPPTRILSIMRSIHKRNKMKTDILPEYITKENLVVEAAWPSICDCPMFAFKPTFKPLKPSAMLDDADLQVPEEMEMMLAIFNPCSTCWACACGAMESCLARCVEKDIYLKDKDNELKQQQLIINYQHHLIATHWNLSLAEAAKSVSIIKKDARLLEEKTKIANESKQEVDELKSELIESKKRIEVMKKQIEDLHEEVEALVQKEEDCLVLKSNIGARDHMINSIVKLSCNDCKKSMDKEGISTQQE